MYCFLYLCKKLQDLNRYKDKETVHNLYQDTIAINGRHQKNLSMFLGPSDGNFFCWQHRSWSIVFLLQCCRQAKMQKFSLTVLCPAELGSLREGLLAQNLWKFLASNPDTETQHCRGHMQLQWILTSGTSSVEGQFNLWSDHGLCARA
jgi:hypothetical protein